MTTKIETPTETSLTQNKAKRTLKDYILLPIILNFTFILLAVIGLFGEGIFGGIAAIIFNLPIFLAAIDWKNKDIKWYFRAYYLIVSTTIFFFVIKDWIL